MESTDCGPACLQMICAYYGNSLSQQFIKDGLSISRIGVTIRDIKERAESLGLETVVAKANIGQITHLGSPAILHWSGNHFVVLYKIRKHRNGTYSFFIADPSNGLIKFSEEEFCRNWLVGKEYGIIMLMRPTDEFYKIKCPIQDHSWNVALSLIKKYIPSKGKVVVSLILILVSMACGWMIPYLYQSIIDQGVVSKNISIIFQLFAVQLAFFVGYILSNAFSSLILSRINLNVGVEYVGELLSKIMRLPMKCFDTKLNTEFIQRLDDFNRVRSFLTDNALNAIYYLINAIVYLSLLWYYSIEAVAIFAIASAIVFLWNLHFLRERKFIDYSLFIENARNRNLLQEIVSNMSDIKANNAQTVEHSNWARNQNHINDLLLQQLTLNYKQNTGRNTINRLRDIIIICYCCIIAVTGDFSIGVLMSISYILGQLGGPIEQLQGLTTQYQMFKISLSRLSEVHRKKDENRGSQKNIHDIKSSIILYDITFKYDGSFSPYIFEHLSVTFPLNKTTAIVGNSGSGKTTLIKLILGFYFPQSGDIKINNESISQIDLNRWRTLCGVVLQDGKIFSGTIADNIALGDDNIDYAKIQYVAKLACIDEFIQKQPGKYNMRIGSTGLELSQGQKQRILIARALYKNPQLLIFDEATSSLDTINERRIMDNLKEFFKGRTVIVVAHRLSTVVNADNIIFLEDGKIAEQGTHKQLVALRGKYYELIKNQLELEA